ncbi:OmpA family protein [Mucilaginibacter sp. CSA2-8R]|uniref:OmpA family protein n=1 Tax=Mucilaginibacter sp. CSA2-8R TaxID=3141542 RepID=UPI00315D99F8
MQLSTKAVLLAGLCTALTVSSCKTKKAVVKPAEPAVAAPATPPPPPPAPAETPKEEPAPPPAKPNFNFSNIQFEFNSGVLKTSSYGTLDKIAAEMKKDPNAKFMINGHSSAEGSAAHNQSLSEDRANAVKGYLTNAGINGGNLEVKGWGESKPLTNNTSEEGRSLNRRVEIKVM